ncbi:tetratricopeptide repeat protein [Streptomyces acidicola]|uniref:tetratricopeptide repeat protein n=1 Tax=Streptomyces acidicola TaxID=2596892 RepID=UPI002AD32FE9|nr:tetratricopeptide repeat protein [Streptomyces acidicola]
MLWFARPPSASERDWLELGRIGLEAAEGEDDSRARTRLLINTGIAHRALNNFSEGLDALGWAVTLARGSDSRFDEAHALNLIGLIHLRRRDLDLADTHFGQALSLYRDLDHRQSTATVLSNIASTRLSAGRLPEATAFHRQAAAVHRDLGDTWQHALELDHLATAVHPKDPQAAHTHWTEALTHLNPNPYSDPRAMAMRSRIEELLRQPGDRGMLPYLHS